MNPSKKLFKLSPLALLIVATTTASGDGPSAQASWAALVRSQSKVHAAKLRWKVTRKVMPYAMPEILRERYLAASVKQAMVSGSSREEAEKEARECLLLLEAPGGRTTEFIYVCGQSKNIAMSVHMDHNSPVEIGSKSFPRSSTQFWDGFTTTAFEEGAVRMNGTVALEQPGLAPNAGISDFDPCITGCLPLKYRFKPGDFTSQVGSEATFRQKLSAALGPDTWEYITVDTRSGLATKLERRTDPNTAVQRVRWCLAVTATRMEKGVLIPTKLRFEEFGSSRELRASKDMELISASVNDEKLVQDVKKMGLPGVAVSDSRLGPSEARCYGFGERLKTLAELRKVETVVTARPPLR